MMIGIGLLILGLVAGGLLVKEIFFDKPKIPEAEYESVRVEESGTDVEGVDKEKAAETMGLAIEMPDEMEKTIKDPAKLKKELENYLIDEGFWSDVKTAKSDGTMTQDFNQGMQIITFVLDNPAGTKVDVTINKDNTFDFNYR